VINADLSIRDAYLQAAGTVAPLLRDPAVAAAWDGPSALAEFTVRGLAGHLASQIFMVGNGLAGSSSAQDAISVSEHYKRVAWIDAPPDSEFNTTIRANGEQAGSVGAGGLADQVEAAVRDQAYALPPAPGGHRVTAPSGEWSLTLDDFVLTRLMEVAVHSDDLAVSVGIETPTLSDDAVMPVVNLLAGIALRRHGQVAILRALTRRERAPATITAF
jgi:hypothetical protein